MKKILSGILAAAMVMSFASVGALAALDKDSKEVALDVTMAGGIDADDEAIDDISLTVIRLLLKLGSLRRPRSMLRSRMLLQTVIIILTLKTFRIKTCSSSMLTKIRTAK